MTTHALTYAKKMQDLGMTTVRVLVPDDKVQDYVDRASADRVDFLHALVEGAPDDDPRLAVLAESNTVQPMTAEAKAVLRDRTKNLQRLDTLLDDLDAVHTAFLDAQDAGETAIATGKTTQAIRHFARAAVAALDYKRIRRTILQQEGATL